jgi:ubiquinone/menaquinone biosynthesis C-methylase UbiE
MRPADDPKTDYKALVERGYDRCASAYREARREETEDALVALMGRLEDGARVLDVGCGAGEPVARELAHRFSVTGVDISGTMVALARANVPQATFIRGDIMSVDFADSYLDAVVAFYSLFHLPPDEHKELFRRIHRWLKPGGFLLATVSATREDAYVEDDFFGVTMYWSNNGLQDYEEILETTGFDVLQVTTVGHGYRHSIEMPEESHPLLLAQRRRQ